MSEKKYISEIPELIVEWNWDKNSVIGLQPNKLLLGSNKKAWWKCSSGHEWETRIIKRTKTHTGCPYCSNKKIIIGFNDLTTTNPDLAKEWNYDKNDFININEVVAGSNKRVWWKCSSCGFEWRTSVQQRTQRKTGCPQCGTDKRVQTRNKTILKNNGSLNIPLLLEEWDYETNGDLLPCHVTNGSGKSIGWKCSKCGYQWKAKILNRANGRGCPLCSNRVIVSGINDLLTTHPELAKEWDFEKNDITPQQVTYGSGRKIHWICPQGHKYQATILHRTNGGTNCPICNSGRQTSFAEQAFLFYIKTPM